jgi:CDP-paratose 2-epimerase
VHTAAQPSHDWAANDPKLDFAINAEATLLLLECMRQYAPSAVFIFTSTNKVYGDRPNHLPLIEMASRWELQATHPYFKGIDETMAIDQTMHSVFGASKVAADIMVQEYGRYFNLNTGIFRGGCITGPEHKGAQLHGFLAYLIKCILKKEHYTIFGYKGKQVRDHIHSWDLANMFWHFYQSPKPGRVYNAGGSRHAHCSILEAIDLAQEISGNTLSCSYTDQNRKGDHKWWVSDLTTFEKDFPEWRHRFTLEDIMQQIFEKLK